MRYGRQDRILHWKPARICRGVGGARGRGSASAHAGQVTPPRLTDDSRGASSALSFTHLALVGVLAHEGLPEALGALRLLAGGNERVRHRGRDHLLCDGGSGNERTGSADVLDGRQINPKTWFYLLCAVVEKTPGSTSRRTGRVPSPSAPSSPSRRPPRRHSHPPCSPAAPASGRRSRRPSRPPRRERRSSRSCSEHGHPPPASRGRERPFAW